MGKLELEMEKNMYPLVTKFVNCHTRNLELYNSKIGPKLQILTDKLDILGAKSTFLCSRTKIFYKKLKIAIKRKDDNGEMFGK